MKKLGKVIGGVFVVLMVLGVVGSMNGSAEGDSGSVAGSPGAGVAPRVPITAERVSLDFKSGRMTIVARVPRSAVNAAGDAFVWAFFMHPDHGTNSWSDMPIRVTPDFSKGDTARVVAVRERFGWWNNSEAPSAGYRAFVFAGADSAATYWPSLQRDKNPERSVPVSSRTDEAGRD